MALYESLQHFLAHVVSLLGSTERNIQEVTLELEFCVSQVGSEQILIRGMSPRWVKRSPGEFLNAYVATRPDAGLHEKLITLLYFKVHGLEIYPK